MKVINFYHRSSPNYINTIASDLHPQVIETIEILPKRTAHAEIVFDLFWMLTSIGWLYDTAPQGIADKPDECLGLECELSNIASDNDRTLCLSSEVVQHRWYADFGKQFEMGIVQIDAQFGRMESLVKDICAFRMAHHEKGLALGIEIVMVDPKAYFAGQQHATSGAQVNFQTA